MDNQQYGGYAPPPGMQGGAGYPPQQGGYPPKEQGGYPQPGYPQPGYPAAGGYPPQAGYSGQQQGFAPLVPPGGVPYGHVPPAPNQHMPTYQTEEPAVKGFEFSDESIRRGFIRKVYSILTLQLSVTVGFIFLFGYHEPTRQFVSHHFEVAIIALVLMLVTVITLSCCEGVRRQAPTNFIVLGLFTLAESYLVGMSTLRFAREDVLIALGLTTAVTLALTIFAFQTKWDFTMMGGVLFCAVFVLFLVGLISMFVHNKTFTLIYSSIGCILFCVYLIYDTQMMMGGTHKYSISPEEYIFGALTLYLDIINIFLYILQILGSSKD